MDQVQKKWEKKGIRKKGNEIGAIYDWRFENMMRSVLCAFLLLGIVLGVSPLKEAHPVATQDAPKEYMENSLGFFVWDIRVEVRDELGIPRVSAGTAFFLEGLTITAKHVVNLFSHITDDVVVIGEAPVHGHDLCDHDHGEGDTFYYHSRREGPKVFQIIYEDEYFYGGEGALLPLQGESGSPVFCMEHDKVVGLVTAVLLDEFGRGVLGIFSIISRDMLKL